MEDKLKQSVLNAFLLVMRPIVKILLRYGIGFKEFSEIVKMAFVDVSTVEFGVRGRPTNISRVAVMTGLTRKEVRRVRTKLEEGDEKVGVKSTPITEVIHRWHSDERFLDVSGRPAHLPFAGGDVSFSALVKMYGGDVPAGAMRTELKRIGCVEESENGTLKVVRRSVIPVDHTDNLITSLVHGAYPLFCTIVENSKIKSEPTGLAQFSAHSTIIRKSDLKRLRRISYDRLSDLAESFDDLFMAFEVSDDADAKDEKSTVAIGLYYFEERDKHAKYNW